MGSAPQLPMLAWQADRLQVWRLLVNHKEYMVDRLNDEIVLLRQKLQANEAKRESEMKTLMAAEVLVFGLGFLAGVILMRVFS